MYLRPQIVGGANIYNYVLLPFVFLHVNCKLE